MKKSFVYVLVFFVSFLYSTESRVIGFSGIYDFLKDDISPLFYPSQIVNFPYYIVLEAGTGSELSEGYSYLKSYIGLGEEQKLGTFGFYLNYPFYSFPFGDIRGVMFSYGKNLSNTLILGFNAGYGIFVEEVKDTLQDLENLSSAEILKFNSGITFYFSEEDFVDLSLEVLSHTFRNEFTFPFPDTAFSEGELNYYVNFRYWRSISDYTGFVIGAHYGFEDNSWTESTEERTFYDLNIGINTFPTGILNLILGINFNNQKLNFGSDGKLLEYSGSAIFGLEAELGKWFIFRFSVKKFLFSRTKDNFRENTFQSKKVISQGVLPVYLGLTYKRGDFRIDGIIAPDILYNGPYFITGIESPLFISISIGYIFDIF